MSAFLILLVIIALVVLAFVGIYNGLVRLRNMCEQAWSDIDVQLKRRYDLIPNLVETVKGYASHEKETFEKVVQARSQAMQATSPADKAQAENILQSTSKEPLRYCRSVPGPQGKPELHTAPDGARQYRRADPARTPLL